MSASIPDIDGGARVAAAARPAARAPRPRPAPRTLRSLILLLRARCEPSR